MRWNPFATRRDHAALLRRIEQLEQQLLSLEGAVMKNETLTALQFHALKYGKPKAYSTGDNPVTREQEIAKNYLENSRLVSENKHKRHCGGYVGQGPAGLFGEATSEQTRPRPDHGTLDDLVRAEDAMREREAWDQMDLNEMESTQPKE